MNRFKFSSEHSQSKSKPPPIFSGRQFYNIYKHAEFLRSSSNIETILFKGYELRKQLRATTPGDYLIVEEMNLEKKTPLMVKKTGPNITVEDFEFTQNRLTGLVAAYAFENYQRFTAIKCSEAEALGLTWDNDDQHQCKLFLSAVSGTEHFYDHFTYWPLICALRKLQLDKITKEPVIKIAKIKNPDGERMATIFLRNYSTILEIWKKFPGSSSADLNKLLKTAPKELKRIFITNK